MVDGSSLENWRTFTGTVSSNLTPSAITPKLNWLYVNAGEQGNVAATRYSGLRITIWLLLDENLSLRMTTTLPDCD